MKKLLLFIFITVATSLRINAQLTITGQQPSCNGFCNGVAQVVNQNGNHYHYLWNTGDTLSAISSLCAGTYRCIISDSLYQPFDTLNITVSQPQVVAILPLALKNVTCNGLTDGYVIFGTTGGTGAGYNFTWSSGYTGTLKDSTIFNLPAGNYSITITDQNNCTANTGFTITQPPAIIISPVITNAASCGVCNGAIAASISGGASQGFNYQWSTSATTASVTGLCAGGYNLTATDTTGCSATARLNVLADQSALSVSFSTATNIDCHHPSGFLFASTAANNGPVQYLWNTGSTGPDIFNLKAGVYHVSVTDSSGCFAVAADTILNLGIIINTVLQRDFSCEINRGEIVIAPAQGSPPYTVHWSTGTNSDTLAQLKPDTYTVTVTDQANCSASVAYNISQINSAVSGQVTGSNVTCKNINNGSAYISLRGGSPPYTYSWNILPVQTNDTATGLAMGSYQVSVTDSFGCTISGNVTIDSNYSQVAVTVTTGNCDSIGSATAILAVGPPPYTYLWNSQPPQTTATADSLYIGTYSVSVTDSTGCTKTGNANIQFNCTGYITGSIFYDSNANCHMDNGENGIAGITVLATNSEITFSGVTNLSGQYTIPVTAAGGYKIITALNASSSILQYGGGGCGYFEVCPASDSVTFINLNDTFPNHNFGYVGSSGFDLAIQAGWNPVDSNHQKEYWILYTNYAFLTPYNDSATITFNYDPLLTFQSGIPVPVNDIANHTLSWTIDSLPSPTYVWADRVRAFFTVPANLPADHELKNSFHIEPYTGDCDTDNNAVYTTEIAGLPADPIYKEVYPKGDITLEDSVLTYIIHFQNTGHDTSRIIKIIDTLSFTLDPQSVVNIASSPLYNQFYIAPGAVLTWVFDPANLPDSAINALTSAGFVSFKAKLKASSHPGYPVQNKAYIYFDASPPVATNTTSNFINFPTAIVEIADNSVNIQVFPNPFSNNATVLTEGINDKYDFELTDMTGRVVKSISGITTNRFQVDRGQLTSGVYIYGIYVNHKPLAYGKLVVE